MRKKPTTKERMREEQSLFRSSMVWHLALQNAKFILSLSLIIITSTLDDLTLVIKYFL